MRILNATVNSDWYPDHFDYLCKQLGHTGETQYIPDYDITAAKANARWTKYSEYYNSFDAVFVPHVPTLSRTFLQNDWKKPLYIWLDFRFDYRIDDLPVYYELMRGARLKPNVKFFAASEHDALYTQRTLGDFPVEIVPPLDYVNSETKVKIPCNENTFFVVNKHNETVFMNLRERLRVLGIPNYGYSYWAQRAPDLRNVKGIVHIPYTYATRSLRENLALEKVYFLPTLNFFERLRTLPRFLWDLRHTQSGDTEKTEWYKKENKNLFVYFSSFEALKEITESPFLKDLIEDRKHNIRAFNQRHNAEALKKWGEIFS